MDEVFPVARYEVMRAAIMECHQIDEVKELHDKTKALAEYSRQARDFDAERRVGEIRIRAERRVGELLKELARADHADAGKVSGAVRSGNTSNNGTRSPYAKALEDNNIPRQTAHRYQSLANVPEDIFEAAVGDRETVATTNGILAKAQARDVVEQARKESIQRATPAAIAALWMWGRLLDFERECEEFGPGEVWDAMQPHQRKDVLRVAPRLAKFLNRLVA